MHDFIETFSDQYKFKLVSFADGGYIWRCRGKKFKREASVTQFFTEINIYNKKKLFELRSISLDSKKILNNSIPGFGYWLWKPSIIKYELDNLDESFDGLVYIDAGCEFNLNADSSRRMKFYFQETLKQGIFTFHLPGFIEAEWTDQIVLDELNVSINDCKSYQRLATVIFFENSRRSKEVVNDWLEKCKYGNHRFLVGLEQNHNHRHDQSLWSITSKRYNIPSISDETFFAPNWHAQGRKFPIWAKRKSRNIDRAIKATLKYLSVIKS